jgi:hypothetical protein
MTVGACEHPSVCLDCTYKCRVITKNNRCTFCNQELTKVAVVEGDHQTFRSANITSQDEFKAGIFWTDARTRAKCLALEAKLCPIPKCGKSFADLSMLKKHLFDAHKRKFCEICLTGQALLLSEHKVFRLVDLDDHLEKGDQDEDNNIIIYHPRCPFCDKRFFNEELFGAHIKSEHVRCTLCPIAETKYLYYGNPLTLRTHHIKTHYTCNFAECADVIGTAFKTKDELESHIQKRHLNPSQKQKVTVPMTIPKEEKFVLRDTEGTDICSEVT